MTTNLPMVEEIPALEPDTWTVNYLQEGPGAWTLRLTRAGS